MPKRGSILITQGDPAGISGEVIARTFARLIGKSDALARCVSSTLDKKNLTLTVAGDIGYLSQAVKRIKKRIAVRSVPDTGSSVLNGIDCIPVTSIDMETFRFGEAVYGRESLAYLDHAIAEAKAGHIRAIVTAPVTKGSVAKILPDFRGHTEYLAGAFSAEARMAFYTPDFILLLETVHIPLADVSRSLDASAIAASLAMLSDAGRKRYGKRIPVAVLALNPHAGEHGLMGKEDDGIIAEAMKAAGTRGIIAEGPFPSDSFFIERHTQFKLILAMYHDQGLIPVKALYPRSSVNVTLGLPVIRTSVDHGSAYDIAGKNKASADGMLAAIMAAVELSDR